MKVSKIIFILTSISLFSVQATIACRPFNEPPACYNFWKYDAVFVGTVKNVEEQSAENNYFPKVEIEVEQNFKGMKSRKAFTYNGKTICPSTRYSKGDKFLIYGEFDEEKENYFYRGLRTQALYPESVIVDFDFLKALESPTPNYWIWVTVSRGDYDSGIAGVKVEVFDGKQKLTGVSDKNGDIKIVVSKEGKYKVRVHEIKGAELGVSNWEEQRKLPRSYGKTKRGYYVDYEVEVLNNRCGWFDMVLYGLKK